MALWTAIMLGMAKAPRKPVDGSKPAGDAKRKRAAVFVTLDPLTEQALAEFLATHTVAPERAAVLLAATKEFLRKHGHYPPRGKPDGGE